MTESPTPQKKYDDRRAGTVIADKYRVDKLIAKGGFSSVYRGVQMGMERPIAVKVLELSNDVKPSWLKRFEREAKLVSQLRNPNTITIFDFGREEDFLYIIMDYIRGRSLSRQLRKFGALSVDDTALIASAILKSLDEAHNASILHRDMKPSNIMLGRDHNDELLVRVLDFGVAKELAPDNPAQTALTLAGAFIGTPRYAAPEQMKREEVSPATDLYGVGMVMWECLTGKPPVPTTDFSTCIEYHLGPDPWRLPEDVECPSGLRNIVYRALEKKVSNRYTSATDMLADLEEWIASESMHEQDDTFVDAPVGLISDLGGTISSDELPKVDDSSFSLSEGFTPEQQFDPNATDVYQPVTPRRSHPDPVQKQRPRRAVEPNERPVQELPKQVASWDPAPRTETAERQAPRRPPKTKNGLKVGLIALAAVGLLALGAGISMMIQKDAETNATIDKLAAPLPPQETIYPAESIIAGMRTANWRVDDPDITDLGDVKRYSSFAMKNGKVAHITIYECQDFAVSEALVQETEPPDESVVFGQTVVRLSRGPSSERNGVESLTGMLFIYKTMLEKRGDL